MGDGILDEVSSLMLSLFPSSLVQVGTLQFFDQWRSIPSSRFVHNMVKGEHLQLRSHPPLFCDFRWFSIKAVVPEHNRLASE